MRQRKRSSPAPLLVLVLLLAVLCAVVFARCGLADEEDEVSTTPERTAAEMTMTAPPVVTVLDQAEPVAEKPALVSRYANIPMSNTEREELAAIVYLEAGNQSPEGQQAVAEVVFNRVVSLDFPDTVSEVLHQGEASGVLQFSTVGNIPLADPTQAQYDAIDAALYGPSILPLDVVYFSRGGENSRVWGEIGDHVFCYGYVWE